MATTIVVAAALQLVLAQQLTLIRPQWLLLSLEIALLVTLIVLSPLRRTRFTAQGRYVSLLLVAVISLDNGFRAVLLDGGLINATTGDQAVAVSFTNATAFSPTDTMPMPRWATGLIAVQSAIALSTTALVIARAVNILK